MKEKLTFNAYWYQRKVFLMIFSVIPYTGLHIRGHNILPCPVTPASIVKQYFKLLPTPGCFFLTEKILMIFKRRHF